MNTLRCLNWRSIQICMSFLNAFSTISGSVFTCAATCTAEVTAWVTSSWRHWVDMKSIKSLGTLIPEALQQTQTLCTPFSWRTGTDSSAWGGCCPLAGTQLPTSWPCFRWGKGKHRTTRVEVSVKDSMWFRMTFPQRGNCTGKLDRLLPASPQPSLKAWQLHAHGSAVPMEVNTILKRRATFHNF